ncbi:MAG: butyrate kinase [Rikenellaceae bacterium]
MKILVINPGSTSTKIALYDDLEQLVEKTIRYSEDELKDFSNVIEQFDFRKKSVIDTINNQGYTLNDIDAVIGRGGIIKPIDSGIYLVNEQLKEDLRTSPQMHASNLGGLIASQIASKVSKIKNTDIPAYIADPVVVDEMQDVARITGLPQLQRKAIFHALNQKAVAHRHADTVARKYEDMNIIVAHLGGGVSIGAHKKGRIIDVNNALDGEGPFSPERAGSLPSGDLVRMCFSGEYTQQEVEKMLCGHGGFMAHVGSNDTRSIREEALGGHPEYTLLMDAMAYNVAKSIGAMAAVLCGEVDAIIITGGVAYGQMTCDYITRMVEFIAPVIIMAGEDEMTALAENVVRANNNPSIIKEYK